MSRRSARRARHGALPAITTFGCLLLGDPGGWKGAGVALGVGIALAPLFPLMLLGLVQAPGSLVPSSWRAWRRHGQEHRPAIPAWLRRLVLAADNYRCVYCGNPVQLQLDHVHPWSYGGRTTFWNLMTLCADCNRVKSNYWVDKRGAHYRPFEGHGNIIAAAAILRVEKRRRWSPARMLRAAAQLAV